MSKNHKGIIHLDDNDDNDDIGSKNTATPNNQQDPNSQQDPNGQPGPNNQSDPFSNGQQDPNGNGQQDPNGNGQQDPNGKSSASIMQQMSMMNAPKSSQSKLDSILHNLNDDAKEDKIEVAMFRDAEFEQMVEILSMTKMSNPLLVGDAGVGKTQLAKELARRIVHAPETLPKLLQDKVVYDLPIGSITAGNSMVGDLEQTIKDILEFASNPDNHAIIFLDEIHQLMTSTSSTIDTIVQQFKPALSNSDLSIIGATTTQEVRSLLKDPAFNDRFTRVAIPPLTDEQTATIIKNMIPKESIRQNNVYIPEELIKPIIDASAMAYPLMKQPRAAITLFYRCTARASILNQKLIATQNLNETQTGRVTQLTINKVLESVNNHVPDANIRLNDIQTALSENIVGQTEQVQEIAKAIAKHQLKLVPTKKPLSFLLAGATGTGKSETAKQIAKLLFKSETEMIYLNMTEYTSSMSISKIVGSSDGYVGSTSSRKMPFDDLDSSPYQVILLDEFEKAHKDIQNLFMQALDEGYIETARGNRVDFSKAIIIATSNAGQITTNHAGFGSVSEEQKRSDVTEALSASFKPELLNRFTKVLRFDSISKEEYKDILIGKYNKFVKQINNSPSSYQITPTVINKTDDYKFINDLVDESYSKEFNGRPAQKSVENFISNTIMNDYTNYQIELETL